MHDSTATILVVDDDRTCLRTLEMMLNQSGFQAHFVDDSRNAIPEIRRLKPQVVLLDMKMPHVDGYEIARQIRCDPETGCIVIIAVTTMVGPEHEQKAAAAGIDRQVTKPVDLQHIRRAILAGRAGGSKKN